MSWMQKLYRTYEYVQEQGLDDENLALPFHMSKAVHLKVILMIRQNWLEQNQLKSNYQFR